MARCGVLLAVTAVLLAVAAPNAMAGQFASQSFGLTRSKRSLSFSGDDDTEVGPCENGGVRAVSPDVMEYLEHGFTCWNRRAIDEMMDMYMADAEVDVSRLLLDESVLRGHDQIRAYYDRMWDTWSGFGWKPCEMAELGDGKYAVLVRLDAEGRGSGTPVTSELTIFYELVDGLIARAAFEPGRSPQLQG